MSYQQKYLKYKQKYQDLKKKTNGIFKLETYNETDINEFNLTDTPTFTQSIQLGGSYDTEQMMLTDTPQYGGMNISPATFAPSAPLTSCAGSVNPMHSVPMSYNNKHYNMNDELNTTTDIPNNTETDDIQNTEDIHNLFRQLGGRDVSTEEYSSSDNEVTTTTYNGRKRSENKHSSEQSENKRSESKRSESKRSESKRSESKRSENKRSESKRSESKKAKSSESESDSDSDLNDSDSDSDSSLTEIDDELF